MVHIRPHKVLDLVKNDERIVKIYLPDINGLMCLETAILQSLIKIIKPKMALEIGTYLGVQTFNMAASMEKVSKLYTLDLDKASFKLANVCNQDIPWVLTHLSNEDKLAFLGTCEEEKITRLYGDSTKFDFSPYYGKMNFIFVDGGHDNETLNSDTINAFKLIDKTKPYCICWHDYGNKNYDVTGYLDKLSNKINIFHIEETMFCLYVNDEVGDLLIN